VVTIGAPAAESASAAGVLPEPVRRLLDRLHAEEIRYCHWKSNEHLGAGLRGETDLDVLVDRQAAPAVSRILSDAGFRRITAVPERGYPGVEDYLGMDPVTGTMVHLHLHYRLVLGEKFLKGYRLPWEETVLATRRWDAESGVYVTHPALEAALLLIRAALKIRLRDRVMGRADRLRPPADVRRELDWLRPRVERAESLDLVGGLIGPAAAEMFLALMAQSPSIRQLGQLRDAIVPGLAEYRTHSPAGARVLRWIREGRTRLRQAFARRLGIYLPARHTLPGGGLVIVFLGSDGSGKSTMTREITRWLSWKLDVVPIYFGSGDGPTSLLRRPLRVMKRARRLGVPAKSIGPADRQGAGERGPRRRAGPLRRLHDVWWGLALVREKRLALRRARWARNLGLVAICDRFPQDQILGFTDGPRLTDIERSSSALLRAAARREQAFYRSLAASPPDLVIKLHVSPSVARQRKPEMSQAELTRRVQAIRDLRFPPVTRVVEIDADQPMPDVVRQVKHAVWQSL
jgi:thymidylate kinase